MARLKGAPRSVEQRLRGLLQYMDLCKEGWELMVSGIRNQDGEVLEQARRKLEEANRIGRDAAAGK